MSVEQYPAFYESTELFFKSNLLPEIEQKFDVGIKIPGWPPGRRSQLLQ
jgi:hypothetical protein